MSTNNAPLWILVSGYSQHTAWDGLRYHLRKFCSKQHSPSVAAWKHKEHEDAGDCIDRAWMFCLIFTHSVIPEGAILKTQISCSFGTGGGSQVKMMIEEFHTESCLQEQDRGHKAGK